MNPVRDFSVVLIMMYGIWGFQRRKLLFFQLGFHRSYSSKMCSAVEKNSKNMGHLSMSTCQKQI